MDHTLWGCVCCHARIGEVPGHDNCVDAGAVASNATVLHGARATPPPRHLHVAAATARLPQYLALIFNQRQKKSSPDVVSTAQRISWRPTLVGATHLFKTFENWNYCHTHGRDVNNTHTGMTYRNPVPSHNLNATRKNTMGGNMAGLHRMTLPSASGCVPPAPRPPQAPTPTMWQQPLPPMNFAPMMARMRPMMPTTPYQAINYMGHQFGPPPPQFGPPPPAVMPPVPPPTPPAGMMMPYYNLYPQSPNF